MISTCLTKPKKVIGLFFTSSKVYLSLLANKTFMAARMCSNLPMSLIFSLINKNFVVIG